MNQDAHELFQMARQDHEAGKLAEAELLYQHVIARDPNHADALHLLGIILAQTDRAPRPRRCSGAAAANPNSADVHNNLANVLQSLGQLEEAIAQYNASLALNPNFPTGLSNLSNTLRLSGRYDDAIAAARRAIELNAGYAPAYVNLGYALQEKGDLEQAIDAFQKALMVRADFPEAQTNLGMRPGSRRTARRGHRGLPARGQSRPQSGPGSRESRQRPAIGRAIG